MTFFSLTCDIFTHIVDTCGHCQAHEEKFESYWTGSTMGTGSFIMRPRPDSAKMTKITLDRVLQDSRALSLLEKYLQRTRALDVLQFWLEVEAFQNTGWKANAVLGINSGVPRKVEQVFGIGQAQFEASEMETKNEVLVSFFEHVLRRQYELRRKGKKWNSREFAWIFSELFDCLGSSMPLDTTTMNAMYVKGEG